MSEHNAETKKRELRPRDRGLIAAGHRDIVGASVASVAMFGIGIDDDDDCGIRSAVLPLAVRSWTSRTMMTHGRCPRVMTSARPPRRALSIHQPASSTA
jgi:hypothetical protein